MLISIAKNHAGIEKLDNPDYPPLPYPEEYTHKYCPWDEELEKYPRSDSYICPDIYGNPETCTNDYEVPATLKGDNGYVKFRDKMNDLAPFLKDADAVEVWNEPNLTDEWTDEGLGPLNPENYANFLNCGIKGLQKGGYKGKIISAAPSPNAPNGPTSLDTLQFFNAFIGAGGLNNVDYIGWHSNVTADIPPGNSNLQGFQSVKYAFGKGKKVWVTEFGWKRDTLPGSEEKQRQLQAQYIVAAYKEANILGNIEAMTAFNFGFYKETQKSRYEDIEGIAPKDLLCQPNTDIPTRQDYGDTIYVHDTTLEDEASLSAVIATALIPGVVNKDIALKTGVVDKTQVEVARSFFDNITHTISNIWCSLGLNTIPFLSNLVKCERPDPNISIGLKETEDDKGMVRGQNTASLSATAKILGAISAPAEMKLIPEDRDCNLGNDEKLTASESGEKRLVDTSAGFGTSAGFFGVDTPDFKTLTPKVWEEAMSARMVDQNLNIVNKLFTQDRRSPDICLRQKDMIRGFYPEAVFPASITCDQIYDIFLRINHSQFPNF